MSQAPLSMGYLCRLRTEQGVTSKEGLEWSATGSCCVAVPFPRTLGMEDSTITLQGKVTVRLDKQEEKLSPRDQVRLQSCDAAKVSVSTEH